MRIVLCILLVFAGMLASPAFSQSTDAEIWDVAESNGEQNRRALLACLRFVQGWMEHADPESGLIPRNLTKDFYWNARDAAADNYPFMVLSTYFTDRAAFDGTMLAMLKAEQRLTSRVDRMPDDYLFATQSFRLPEPNMDDVIFGSAEYVKDGLTPLTELLGPSPWSERMLGLLEDIWKHAEKDTEVGLLPSTSHEVCGDLLQSQSRVYWMTGNDAFRDQVFRLADYFFVHHPPEKAEQLRFDDHGCEVISGLSEAYYIAAHKDPAKYKAWQPAMHRLLDRILEVGRDENGLLWNLINPVTGEVLSQEKTDNWGYNYNAFLVVAELDDADHYRAAVTHTLNNLMKNKDYAWEGDIADGIADSLEGGLNLLNRLPNAEAAAWADYMAERLLSKQRDTGVVAGWHGDGNFARTALMFALWKSQGAWLEPWRSDLRIGVTTDEDGTIYMHIKADWPWKGVVRLDKPRHSEWFHMPFDYPRLNQFPEWFTMALDEKANVNGTVVEAQQLRDGYAIEVTMEHPVRLTIKKESR